MMAKRHNMDIDFGWGDDDDIMADPMSMELFGRRRNSGDFRNKRYIEAYGNYSGGYGPPRPLMSLEPYRDGPPRPPFLMERRMGPRGPPPSFTPGRLMGPRQPHPFFLEEREIGPRGPHPPKRVVHDDQAIKYLLRCGVPKESVKNLPSDLLQLIEPQYCGLCGYGFDSFPTSRLHYVSKNHLKAQKRWVSQKSETGQQREVPLKARELYCELCDVHITSKVHADSHYSGKPHRAIVEGRKNPKNPILLQKSSKARLEQLIRREKRHIKVAKEGDSTEEPSTSADKPVQNDLYCDICKTSVTCAEQMTMHLNGKRHLTKEKQHILKVMKGEITDVAVPSTEREESTQNLEEEEDPNNEQQNENDEKNEQNTSDWGDGTGTWEEK